MPVISAYELRGGSHDRERHEPQPPPPGTLIGITTADEERFARSGEHVRDAPGGVVWTVFRFNDGTATAEAHRRFCGDASGG